MLSRVRFRRMGMGLMLFALIFLLHTPTWGQGGGAWHETFDDPALPGWERSPDVTAEGGVLRLGAGGFAYHGGMWQDGTLSVLARCQQDADLVFSFRASDMGSYHVVLVNKGYLVLQREENGALTELGSAELPEPLGADWFLLTVFVEGPTLNVELNGQPLIGASDPAPLPPGGVALEVLGPATLEVDEMAWDTMGGGPQPPGEPQGEPQGEPGEPHPSGEPQGEPQGEPGAPQPPGEPSGEPQGEPDTLQPPAAPPIAYRAGAWTRMGGPLGGLGYDIRMRPDNPDVMYVTDAWAGVFMSTDGGRTWFPANNGITARTGMSGDAIPIFSLTVDPHNPNIVWAGTQFTSGIFKSTDGGQTWVEMDNGVVEANGVTFRGFTVDPRSSDIVYAAGEVSSWAWAGQEQIGREFDKVKGVVYRTTDGGQSWQAIWRGDNLARYVWIDPRDPNVIYISTGIFDREAANSDAASNNPGGVGVVKSTDGGQTWQQVNNGLRNLYIGTLFMHPTNPDILLAGAGSNAYPEGEGVYLTTDGGQSWQQVLANDNINSVEFATADPNIAYAGSANAVYRSEDGGHTWQRMTGEEQAGWGPPGVRTGFPIDFQVDPRDPNRIFANNYGGGNFLSEDGGRTWQVASAGYTGAQVRDVAVDPTDPARVYAASRSGMFRSDDGGRTWVGLSRPPAYLLEWYAVAVDPLRPEHILAASNMMSGAVLSGTGHGETWHFAEGSRLQGKQAWRVFAFAPGDPQTVYAGSSAFYSAGTDDERMPAAGVYVSHDGGESWQPANDANSQDANVTALAVDPRNAQVVYAATGNRGLLKSTDGGQSWQALNVGVAADVPLLAVALDPSNPDVVLVGLGRGGVRRSTDGGQTWQTVGAGMNAEAAVSDIVFDPTNPRVLYAADRFSGVYRSQDGGQSWQAFNDGLLLRDVNALAISADGAHLYAGTEGNGVYRVDLNGTPPSGMGGERG